MSLFDSIGDVAGAVVGASAAEVEIRSNVAPPVKLSLASSSSSSSSGGLGDLLLAQIRPAITIHAGELGTFTVAPYGEPSPNAWRIRAALLGLGAATVAGLAIYGGMQLARKLRK